MTKPFNLLMISAEMEGCGNTTHRHFDSHPNCFVYPMESQLGNKHSRNILCPFIHPVRYGYPEFPEGTTFDQALTSICDEEVKAYVRNPQRSKFRDCGMVMGEERRREAFISYCVETTVYGRYDTLRVYEPFTRARVIEAYFRSAFDAWENLNRSGQERVWVGYNPGMVMETDKLLRDFPDAHIIHVVRNPFSAYGDYLKRPYGQQSLEEYCLAWNVAHGAAFNYAAKYPDNFHLLRIESFFEDKRGTLEPILAKVGLPWSDTLLYPSFNGKDISSDQRPWGTVEKPTTEYNLSQADSLHQDIKAAIADECALVIKTFGYQDIMKQIGFGDLGRWL